MNIPKSEREIFDFVNQEHENVLALHKELNDGYIVHISNNISQKRNFYQNLATLSGVLMGFAPFLFQSDKIKQPGLIYFSIFFLMLVIVLIINYLRALMDDEGNQMKKQLDGYNEILDLQMQKRRNFLVEGKFTEESFRGYLSEMNKVSGKIIEINKNQNQEKIKKEHKRMDYAGEFFILFFVMGIILMMISLTDLRLNIVGWSLLAVLLFLMIFFVPFHKLFIYLGYPIDYANNKFFQNKDE